VSVDDVPLRFLVRAYHGTSRAAADTVVADGRFGHGSGDRFGTGTYFFEENAERAWNWARMWHGTDAAVVVAQLDLTDGGLDLTQKAGRELVLGVLGAIDVEEIQRRANERDRAGFVDAVALELLDPNGEIQWIRVLVFDTGREYDRAEPGPATITLTPDLRQRDLRSRIVRNVQCHLVVRGPGVITTLRRLEEQSS
jgi:hypothetical protein